ncbi:MAG TPA: hypothetical protein VFS67_15310 [Polyangiaceae bacterium]|jgi:hypothetical protein|nr:hypothetical protein [Polyangiaceae bacterium]
MHHPSSASTLRYRRLLCGSALAALLAGGACQSEDSSPGATVAPFSGNSPAPSAGSSGIVQATGANNPTSALGSGGAGTVESGPASDISLSPNANNNAAAPVNAGGAAGAASMPPKPCVDTAPPFDPEWPDATCERWATETSECSAGWFANYCDVSCGRCVPEGGSPLPAAVDCSGAGLPNVTGGNGYTTRYWDCCQTHCAQFDGHKCGQDGISRTGDSNSACNGGGSFACYDEAPRAVSDCLSYGYIAKANPNCGGCYRIQFTGEGQYNPNEPGSRLIKGKQMIVKVSNTGSDVNGNQFDLMIPGGGVGLFNACSRQWNSNDLGAQYGGFLTNCTGGHSEKKECVRRNCMKIPAGPARDGCLWFVDWFEVADDPKFTSQPVDCPF